jgi:hypothetical protein
LGLYLSKIGGRIFIRKVFGRNGVFVESVPGSARTCRWSSAADEAAATPATWARRPT